MMLLPPLGVPEGAFVLEDGVDECDAFFVLLAEAASFAPFL